MFVCPWGLFLMLCFVQKYEQHYIWLKIERKSIKRFDFLIKLENLVDVNAQNNPGSNIRKGHNVLKI